MGQRTQEGSRAKTQPTQYTERKVFSTEKLTSLASKSALYSAEGFPLLSPPGASRVSALKANWLFNTRLSMVDRPQSDAPATTTCELTGVLVAAPGQKANKAKPACKPAGAACSLCLGATCLQHTCGLTDGARLQDHQMNRAGSQRHILGPCHQ